VFYISVNDEKEKELLKYNPHAKNLKDFVKIDTSYTGLGIDRVMACKAIYDGVVVDAGSAITLDIMQNGVHLGGVIFPGISALKEAYAKISPKLDVNFGEIDFKKLPQNTTEAVTYGGLGSIIEMIKSLKKDKTLYLTGGDGKFLGRYLDGVYIKDLVFRGMLETIKQDLRS
jgi:type III pantothenate kinase